MEKYLKRFGSLIILSIIICVGHIECSKCELDAGKDQLLRSVLRTTPQDVVNILRETSTSPKLLTETVNSLIGWFKTQKDLPKIEPNRNWIERLLLTTNHDVELTKDLMRNTYVLRKSLRNILDIGSPAKLSKDALKSVKVATLPQLTKDGSRVVILKVPKTTAKDFNFALYFRMSMLMCEYRMHYDYSINDIYILDIENLNDETVHKIDKDMSYATEFGTALQKLIGVKSYKSVIILNGKPNISENFLKLVKTYMAADTVEAVHIVNNFNDLLDEVPLSVLPKDYGGEQEPIDCLSDKMFELYSHKETTKWYQQLNDVKRDEL